MPVNFTTQALWFEQFLRRVDLWVGINDSTDQAFSIESINPFMEKV